MIADLFIKLWKKMPSKIKPLLTNRFTFAIYRYSILRPKVRRISGITVELTDRCNLKCSYCPKGQGIGIKDGDMDFDLFRRIVDEAFALFIIKQIPLVGFGEPLLYPHLDKAILYIKQKDPSVRVTLTTNGILLTPDKAMRLVKAGLDQITISVNAISRDKYLKINGADLYETVVSHTIAFLKYINQSNNPHKVRVLVQVLAGLNKAAEIEEFQSFWKPHLGSCGEIQIQPFVNWGGIIKQSFEEGERKKSRYPCAHIQSSCIITREGEALACCMVFPADQGDLALGSIKEKSLKELYTKGKIVKLRKMNLNGVLYKLSPCKHCNAFKTVPNVWIRNLLYPYIKPRWI